MVAENKSVLIFLVAYFLKISLAVLQLYGVYRLWSINHLIIVQKRYPQIILIEAFVVLCYLLIASPLLDLNLLNLTDALYPYSSILKISGYVTYCYFSHFIINAEGARLWLIYFNLQHSNSTSTAVWESKIDTTLKQQNTDWFLNNKHKYGNTKWVVFRYFLYYLFAATFACILFLIFGDTHWVQLIDGSLYGLPVVITIYVFYKCPKTSTDYFLFHYEFKTTTFSFIFGLSIYLIAQLIYYFDYYISSVIVAFVMSMVSAASLISTLWIPTKILSNTNWNSIHDNKGNSTYVMNIIHEPPIHNKQSTHAKLINLLKNEVSLPLFIQHMIHEFSLENILCFIELVQFKQYLRKLTMKISNTDNNNISDTIVYELAASIPKSTIVYGAGGDNNLTTQNELILYFKNCSYLLFLKYIHHNTEYAINIAYELSNEFYDMMKNKELWLNTNIELIKLDEMFDAVICEMFLFLMQSFARFEKKHSYQL